MTEINPELFKHILDYHLFYFIGSGIIFFLAGAYVYEKISKNLENKDIEGLNDKKSVFWCGFLLFISMFSFSFIGGITTTADSMAGYLQATNKNLSGVKLREMYHFIAELDTEDFILLNKKTGKYEKEQRDIKSIAKLETEGEAERREKQRKINIKKEVEKSVRE